MSNLSRKLNRVRSAAGFTLLEVFLAVAVLGAAVSIGTPLLFRIDALNNADISETVLVSYIRRASELSRSGEKDSVWGVRASNATITLFRGTSYATRVIADDTIFTLFGGITATGTDLVFNRITGFPVASSTHTLKQVGSFTKTVTTNPLGVVQVTQSM
jgi:type II secretory pathway pseudopilin PulG